jgi:hypothetical protein
VNDFVMAVADMLHADSDPVSVEFWNPGTGVMLGRISLNGNACIYLHPDYVDLLNDFGQLRHDDFAELSDSDLSGAVLLSYSVKSTNGVAVDAVADFVRFCANSIVSA